MSELPPGWAEATLGETCFPVSKVDPRQQPDAAFTYIDIGGIDDLRIAETKRLFGREAPSRARQLVQGGDTLLSTVRTYLRKTALVPKELDGSVASTGFCVLRPVPAVEPRYIFYRVTAHDFVSRLSPLQTGSSYPAVRDRDVFAQTVELPPLNEQRRIVAAIEEHLSRLDAADASLAQAESRIAALRVATFAAATAGHPWAELGSVTTAHRYGTSIKCLAEPVGPPVLRIPNIRSGRIDTTDLKYATASELGDTMVESGDLLFVRTNGSRDLIGRVAAVDGAVGMAFASYLIRARPDPSALDPRWAVVALSTQRARADIESRAASTAGQYNLNLKSLKSLKIPLPPLEEQRRIVAEVEARLSALDALCASIDRAQRRSRALRAAVLARAFRGELVPQDPSDEPASVLLNRIRAERATSEPATGRRRKPVRP